jgi:hypothetical protein
MGSAHRLPPIEDHAEAVILSALAELGLTETYLRRRLDFAPERPSRWSAYDLDIGEWVRICTILCLHLDSISDGYDRRWHLAKIRTALAARTLDLPRTPQLLGILRELRAQDRANWRWESKQYGFHLRWRIRRRRLLAQMRRFPRWCVHQATWIYESWRCNRCLREHEPGPAAPGLRAAPYPAQ